MKATITYCITIFLSLILVFQFDHNGISESLEEKPIEESEERVVEWFQETRQNVSKPSKSGNELKKFIPVTSVSIHQVTQGYSTLKVRRHIWIMQLLR